MPLKARKQPILQEQDAPRALEYPDAALILDDSKTNHFPPMKKSIRGFTLMELLTVVAICTCLVALLIPGLAKVREKSDVTRCVGNLKQIGAGLISYATDSNGYLPPVAQATDRMIFWPEAIAEHMGMSEADKIYIKRNTIFHCPTHPHGNDLPTELASTYMMNLRLSSCPPAGITGRPLGAFTAPASTVLLAESTGQTIWINASVDWDPRAYSPRHGSLMNLFFLDGHIEAHKGPIDKKDDERFGLVDPKI